MRHSIFAKAIVLALALASGRTPVAAQAEPTTAIVQSPASEFPPLTEFVGTYTYQGGTMEIAAPPDGLYAVIDGGKYPLRRKSADVFINGGGADVTFHRGPDGVVKSVEDNFWPVSASVCPHHVLD